jgi:hypothetical protein
VVRSPSPRLIRDPSPAERSVRPRTLRVRAPTDGHAGIPDRSVRRILSPAAVALERARVDGKLVRDTFDAARVTLELLPAITPGGEVVEESGVELERGLRSKTGLDETSLTGTDQNRTGFGCELDHALVNGKRRAAGLVDVDPKEPFGGGEDAAGRRIDAIGG